MHTVIQSHTRTAGYSRLCADYMSSREQDWFGDGVRRGPLPRSPPLPAWHRDYAAWVDARRLQYLQLKQHREIAE